MSNKLRVRFCNAPLIFCFCTLLGGIQVGKGKNGVFIRAHDKSKKKAKARLKELTSRSQGRNVRKVMENVKVYIRGWLGYFGISSMKATMQRWDEWLRRRLRVYIWKQWKVPKARIRNLMKLGSIIMLQML